MRGSTTYVLLRSLTYLNKHDNIITRDSFWNQVNYYNWLSFESFKPFWKNIVDFDWYFWNNLGHVFHDLSGSDVNDEVKNKFEIYILFLFANLSCQIAMFCGRKLLLTTWSHRHLNNKGIVMEWTCFNFDSRRFWLNRNKVSSGDHLSKGFNQTCNCWTIRELYWPYVFTERITNIKTCVFQMCNWIEQRDTSTTYLQAMV